MSDHHQLRCVLLADGSLGSALQAARLLAQRGVEVAVACAGIGGRVLGASKAVMAATDLPDNDTHDYVGALLIWLKTLEGIDHGGPIPVVPLSDRLAAWLDSARERVEPPYVVGIPPSPVLQPLLSKHLAMLTAERAGLDVAPWRLVSNPEQADFAVEELGMPLIVRPTSWSTHGDAYFKQAIFRDPDDATTFLRSHLNEGAELVVQRFLDVEADSIEFAIVGTTSQGEIQSLTTGRKRASSSDRGGVLAWGQAAWLPDTAHACRAFIAEAWFTGVGGIEFIRHQGRLWFVEFNPRLEAIHFLSDVAGVPHLWPHVAGLAGLRLADPKPPTQRPAAIWMETAWLDRVIDQPKSIRTAVVQWRQYRRFPERASAIFDPTDLRPGVAYLSELGSRGFRRLRSQRRRISA